MSWTLVILALRAVFLSIWVLFKPVLGWLLIVVGLIGMPMPIMNGVIFLLLGIALVGHRNWVIRWSRVRIKLLLARWAALPTPVIGLIGRLANRSAQQISKQYRRMRWWQMERRARRAPGQPHEATHRPSDA